MKITVPVLSRQQVGSAFTTTSYTDGRDPANVVSASRPVYEFKTGSAVLVDNDFQIARRITGLGNLTYKSVLAVTVAPVVLGAIIVFGIGQRIAAALVDEVRDLAEDVPAALGDIHRHITGVLKDHLSDVIS